MKGTYKKIATIILGAVCVCTCMFTMIGCSKAGENTYSIWLYQGQDTAYYTNYSDNPVLKYLQKRTWNDKNIKFEFLVPPAGQAQNNYETMIGSGDFPTLMQDSVSDPAPVMYEDGLIMDITQLVKDNMPNYYKLIQENTALKNKVVFDINGEEKILSITSLNEGLSNSISGMVYRRDWIVKYGKNSSTNEAFTGSFTDEKDPDSWSDNVKFPSWYNSTLKEKGLAVDSEWDGSDPLFISDWEWMFEIFTKAQTALGIKDSYSTSVYYPGLTWAGGLTASFGKGGAIWYQDTDGKVQFGGTEDSMRAYFQCLNSWYENGWLDQDFNTRSGDMFFMIDNTAVRSGEIGMWTGLEGDLGNRIDLNDGGNTEGIFVSGCAFPINDKYGTDSCKFAAPRADGLGGGAEVGTGFFVMDGADKKDLATLLTFLDYLYSEEGAALRTVGLNKTQLSEDGTDTSFYNKYKLTDGAYTLGEDGRLVVNQVITKDSGSLSIAASLDKLPGLQLINSLDKGISPTLEKSLKSWIKYPNKAAIWGSTAALKVSSSDNDKAQKAHARVVGFMETNAYKFIKGDKDIDNDKEWNGWCNSLAGYKYDDISKLLQPYITAYPVS